MTIRYFFIQYCNFSSKNFYRFFIWFDEWTSHISITLYHDVSKKSRTYSTRM